MSVVVRLSVTFGLLSAAVPAGAQLVGDQAMVTPRPAVVAAVLEDAMPEAPKGVASSFVPPARDSIGGYITPNRDLSPEELVWHLRVALNVAALGCRDADEAATVAGYNALLAGAKTHLAAAQAGVIKRYQVKFGAAGQARNDDAMTKLYNFFAQPTGHDGFCATAKRVLVEAAAVEPAALPTFALTALPRLEAPFIAFFADYDRYRALMASWRARNPSTMSSAPAPALVTASAPVAAPAPALMSTVASGGATAQPVLTPVSTALTPQN